MSSSYSSFSFFLGDRQKLNRNGCPHERTQWRVKQGTLVWLEVVSKYGMAHVLWRWVSPGCKMVICKAKQLADFSRKSCCSGLCQRLDQQRPVPGVRFTEQLPKPKAPPVRLLDGHRSHVYNLDLSCCTCADKTLFQTRLVSLSVYWSVLTGPF